MKFIDIKTNGGTIKGKIAFYCDALHVTVKAWGFANSLTGFTAISFCGMYLSIIFMILSCAGI